AGVTEGTWIRLVEKKDPSRDVLYYCMDQPAFPPSIKERILLNHSVPDDFIRIVAQHESGQNLALINNNQVRLLRSPGILESLEQNQFLTIDQKRRIEEFKTEFIFKAQVARHGADELAEITA